MIVQWLDDAINDLMQIKRYISWDNSDAAKRVAEKILKAIHLLESQPAIGRPGRISGTKEWIVANTSYIIPYCVRDNRILILRILHSARAWPDQISF